VLPVPSLVHQSKCDGWRKGFNVADLLGYINYVVFDVLIENCLADFIATRLPYSVAEVKVSRLPLSYRYMEK
jgi:hypothetical protein